MLTQTHIYTYKKKINLKQRWKVTKEDIHTDLWLLHAPCTHLHAYICAHVHSHAYTTDMVICLPLLWRSGLLERTV